MSEPQLLISDYAGHPFTYELADALDQRRPGSAAYSYCATTVAPHGRFSGDVPTIAVGHGWTFEKYRPLARLASELRYGLGLGRVLWRTRPEAHVVCNMPLASGAVAWLLSLPLRTPFILWFQDVQSGLASASVGDGFTSRAVSRLETFILKRARRVIAISAELADEAARRGVRPDRIGVLENWAPVERLPALPVDDAWIQSIGVTARPVFLYAGTLGRKHDPTLLVDLAESFRDSGHVVVISEGEGAETLRAAVADGGLTNLAVLPYQPFDDLAQTLASADVLVALLEPSASAFSVPSKTLSYLCAGRPILASIPLDNAAARLISERAQAGIVVPPGDRARFVDSAHELASDDELRAKMGASGRRYAEVHFAEGQVVDTFLTQVHNAAS